jgi:2-iminobutanoate/2-iminopropanoate deaminase
MNMEKKVVTAPDAPAAIGPYSPAIHMGDYVFVSGTVGADPASGELVDGGIEAQTHQALTNLSHVLASAGTSMDWVVKTTVFMQDLADFAAMNRVYGGFFPQDPPARSTVQVAALPVGAAVEIEAIAWVPEEA